MDQPPVEHSVVSVCESVTGVPTAISPEELVTQMEPASEIEEAVAAEDEQISVGSGGIDGAASSSSASSSTATATATVTGGTYTGSIDDDDNSHQPASASASASAPEPAEQEPAHNGVSRRLHLPPGISEDKKEIESDNQKPANLSSSTNLEKDDEEADIEKNGAKAENGTSMTNNHSTSNIVPNKLWSRLRQSISRPSNTEDEGTTSEEQTTQSVPSHNSSANRRDDNHHNGNGESNHNIAPSKLWNRLRQTISRPNDSEEQPPTKIEPLKESNIAINQEESDKSGNDEMTKGSSNNTAQPQSVVAALSRWRQVVTKVYEESTVKLAEVTHSDIAHIDTNSSEQKSEEDEALEKALQEALLNDPEIVGLQSQILYARNELDSMKESGKNADKRRKQEIGKLRQDMNGKSRALWFGIQKMRRFNGLTEYNEELMKCTLSSHDSSPPTVMAEAKLLRAQHQGTILDRQMKVVHVFQQDMIDYLYAKALPDIKDEHDLAAKVGQAQVDKMIKSQQNMVQLFEDCLGLQRKIMAKYKLRELEHFRSADNNELLEQQVEHLNVMAGNIPAMERDPALRDSAKKRLEERLKLIEIRGERRRSRDEELLKDAHEVQKDEKTALERANDQIASLSNHSVDLLLQDEDEDDGADYDAKAKEDRLESRASRSDNSEGEFEDDSELVCEVSRAQVAMRGPMTEMVASTADTPEGEQTKNIYVQQTPVEPSSAPPISQHRSLVVNAETESEHQPSTTDISEGEFDDASKLEMGVMRQQVSTRVPVPDMVVSMNENPEAKPNVNVQQASMEPSPASSSTPKRSMVENKLLERARAARISRASVGSTSQEAAGSSRRTMRPSLGAKAMSTREFASRRISTHRPAGGSSALGSSEHRASAGLGATSDQNTRTTRASFTVGAASADRQARMERLASRRSIMETSGSTASPGIITAATNRPSVVAERRVERQGGLSPPTVTNTESASAAGHSNNGETKQ